MNRTCKAMLFALLNGPDSENGCMILLSLCFAMVNFHAIVNLVCIADAGA